MRKKILAAVLVLALAASILPLAAYAEGDGACAHYTGTWVTDANGHKFVCTDCGESMIGYSEHQDNNVDGKCDVCGYIPECVDANNDCVCDTCGAEAHNWVWTDNGGYTHEQSCSKCGKVLSENAHHRDLDWNCICDDCGAPYHELLSYFYSEIDASGHWWTCERCYAVVGEKEPHSDANGDGTCDICGWGCQHTSTKWVIDGQYGHYKFCNDCGKHLTDYAEHNMVNGKCEECGFSLCADGHTWGTGYDTHKCTICGYKTNHVDENSDHHCDICGYIMHTGAVWCRTETHHWFYCSVCDLVTSKQVHYDWDADGICDSCDYVMSAASECEHENIVWEFNQGGHWAYCGNCYKTVVEYTEHDGSCDICGYTPCADDQHVFGEQGSAKHTCQACGYMTDCVDENRDDVCDICGQEAHVYADYQTDENNHWMYCPICKQEFLKGEHYDNDQDGKCDFCEYVMQNEKPADPSDTPTEAPTEPEQPADSGSKDGLDDVPKTGDLSMMVIGAAVLVFGVCAVALVRKRAV